MTEAAWRDWVFLLPALTFAAVVYHPITHNYFHSDDFLNFYQIANNGFERYWLTPNGGHIHLARNAIFYAMERLFGPHPEPYYWCAFLTHLVNVWLLFRVIRLLTHSPYLASFGAALWGISPLNEGTLGWYAVYGHALVGTVVLVIMCQVERVAAATRIPSTRMRYCWYALALIAVNCFGTGLGIAIVLPFALYLLLQPPGRVGALRRIPLISLVVIVPALYLLVTLLYATPPESMAFWETLLIKPAAVPLYLAHLIAFGLTRLLFGAYFPAWMTLGVWYGVLGSFVIALVGIWPRSANLVRRRIAACTLLLVGAYGMIALGRASILFALPMSFFVEQWRYHYVGQLILTIILCLLLNELAFIVAMRLRTVVLGAWYGVAVCVYVYSGTPIDNHLRERQETERALAIVRGAIEAQPSGDAVYIKNRSFPPLLLPPAIFPGLAAAFTMFFPEDVVDGRRVYFVDGHPAVLGEAQRGTRTRTLIVPSAPKDGGRGAR